MNNLMKQAQKMQKSMEQSKTELEAKSFEATSGGGAVKCVVGGDRVIKSVTISPEVVSENDAEMLEDLIVTCLNDALSQIAAAYEDMLSQAGGGLGMGGGFF